MATQGGINKVHEHLCNTIVTLMYLFVPICNIRPTLESDQLLIKAIKIGINNYLKCD